MVAERRSPVLIEAGAGLGSCVNTVQPRQGLEGAGEVPAPRWSLL